MKTSYSKSPVYKTRAASKKKAENPSFPLEAAGSNHDVIAGANDANLSAINPSSEKVLCTTRNKNNTSKQNNTIKNNQKNKNKLINTTNVYVIEDNSPLKKETEEDNPVVATKGFLQEPFHAVNLFAHPNSVENLNGDKWLSTDLIDFLIKYGIPLWKTTDLLVPTSAVEGLLDLYNEKAKSTDSNDQKFVQKKRQEYHEYKSKPYRIITLSCTKDHFIVISMIFDATDVQDDFFQYITIYDSLKRSYRNERNKNMVHNLQALDLLKKYQLFFANYLFYDTEYKNLLINNPNLITKHVSYDRCPIQQNSYDCSLFAYGIMLHLVRGITITSTIFSQSDIDYFRKSLYIIFNATENELPQDPKKYISTRFISSFFSELFETTNKDDIYVKYLHKHNSKYLAHITAQSTILESNKIINTNALKKMAWVAKSKNDNSDELSDDDSEYMDPEEDEDISVPEEDEDKSVNDLKDNANDNFDVSSEPIELIEPYYDDIFNGFFIDNNDYQLKDLNDLTYRTRLYEEESGIKTKIAKSSDKTGSRRLECTSHKNCTFYASFGPRRGNKKLILKNRNLYHGGIDKFGLAADGRRLKNQISEYIEPTIEQVELIKSSKPITNDIIKATKALAGKTPTYNQAYKVLSKHQEDERFGDTQNYKLLIPYLQEFKQRNNNSIVNWDRDNNKAITNLFVCPSIMNNKLRYVRPVMSLDAAHLSSDSKGTLYLATIKSGNDKIIIVAIGMTIDNENLRGWKYFLENLKVACPQLTNMHPLQRCQPYKLFTFISDRDKGLIPALREVFPENHHTNCLVHIRDNVLKNCGLKAANLATKIGYTFSFREEDKLFAELNKISAKAYNYVNQIDPTTWRNTEWLRNQSLPPRYGIHTSNNSESANSMFKDARGCTWLQSLDKMIHITMVQTTKLRQEYANKKGMLPVYVKEYKKLYTDSAKYEVIRISDKDHTYKTYIGTGNDYNHRNTHEVNVNHQMCTCGKWQDSNLLCVHAMAYYRKIDEKTLTEVLAMRFNNYYSYQYLHKLYNENINPVIINVLTSDRETLPPPENKKRQPGRPATKRKQKRSRSEVTVRCGNCGEEGHNKKSCNKPSGYKEMKIKNKEQEANESAQDNNEDNVPIEIQNVSNYSTSMTTSNMEESIFY
jgi:hypothetical protein